MDPLDYLAYVEARQCYHYHVLEVKKNGGGALSLAKEVFYHVTIVEIMKGH